MKKVITIFLEFKLKFLSFFIKRKINKTSGSRKRSKFSSLPGAGVLLIFKIFQNVTLVEKAAEYMSRVGETGFDRHKFQTLFSSK